MQILYIFLHKSCHANLVYFCAQTYSHPNQIRLVLNSYFNFENKYYAITLLKISNSVNKIKTKMQKWSCG